MYLIVVTRFEVLGPDHVAALPDRCIKSEPTQVRVDEAAGCLEGLVLVSSCLDLRPWSTSSSNMFWYYRC
jgi:hypothetical protein